MSVYSSIMEQTALTGHTDADGRFVEPLTPRERQVAEAITRGLSNRQIADELGISAETVKRHLASIYSKLALPGRVALAMHVVRSRAA